MTLVCLGLIFCVFYLSVKFYRSANWDEPAESTPDFAQMRKREAELLHVQDVLQGACDSGKLSKAALEEYIRYADIEIERMKAIERDWALKKRG